MKSKNRYRPKIDKLFWLIFAPTNALIISMLIVLSLFEPVTLYAIFPISAFVNYFFVSPLFSYVELREDSLFIKYGFILKKEIPYDKIRGLVPGRCWYSESMLNIKLAMEHITVKYNKFDTTIISVKDNDAFIRDFENIISKRKTV